MVNIDTMTMMMNNIRTKHISRSAPMLEIPTQKKICLIWCSKNQTKGVRSQSFFVVKRAHPEALSSVAYSQELRIICPVSDSTHDDSRLSS